jgi:peptide deformylase
MKRTLNRPMYLAKHLIALTASLLIIFSCGVMQKQAKPQYSESQFSPAELELINGSASDKPMRVFKTDKQSDSILLRTVSSDVRPDTSDLNLNTLIRRMYITVNDSLSMGVGIAAPQVGVLKRVIWVQRFDKPGEPFEAYLNPKIVQYSQLKQERRELRGDPKTRSYAILIEYFKPDMTFQREMVEGFTAIIFQHEIDHLNGILFTDYLK